MKQEEKQEHKEGWTFLKQCSKTKIIICCFPVTFVSVSFPVCPKQNLKNLQDTLIGIFPDMKNTDNRNVAAK